MSDKKQTAVEWLFEQYKLVGMLTKAQVEKAKEMEKQQIAKSVQWCLSGVMDEESALNEGHKFYNEAFQRAYGVDEPDYNNVTIRNRNPDYKP